MKQVLYLAVAVGMLLLIFILTPPLCMKLAPGFWLTYPPARTWDRVHETLLFPHGTMSHGAGTATRATLKRLRVALAAYRKDLGRFPHTGTDMTPRACSMADETCLGLNAANNVLASNEVGFPFGYLGRSKQAYLKAWKGPYLDDEPQYRMADSWGAKIRYVWFKSALWLQSGGEDKQFEALVDVIKPSYRGDDLYVRVSDTDHESETMPVEAPPCDGQ